MKTFYTSEKNHQILIALMKAHGVKKIVASPGGTNIGFVASVQQDPFFEIYSSVDERSAAYIACGLAAESGEPVALSCTGATASRNYFPGLTEAFYRKLPILTITSSRPIEEIGHNIPQVTDRQTPPSDIAKLSVYLPAVHSEEDIWNCEINVNKAILELRHRGGGPVHINLRTMYSSDFSVKELIKARVIDRICYNEKMPDLKKGRIGVYVGAHLKWSEELTKTVDRFCECYDAVVICDHTSNYKGKYGVMANLVANQIQYHADCCQMDIMIHIGDISGAYMHISPNQVWRVNPDGEIRDTFKKLRYVFEMEELDFFRKYIEQQTDTTPVTTFYDEWHREYTRLSVKADSIIDDVPFSNIWIAHETISRLPAGSVLHLGILNCLRSWSFFEAHDDVLGYSNVGGFGIDGCVSSLIGASLYDSQRLYIGVVGDLAFFYDMNSLGNRHVGNNVRIMVINNGRGTEFRNKINLASRAGLGDDTDTYIAAAGHFGKQSRLLVRHYAEDLGFEYFSAENKEEFLSCVERFLLPEITERPKIFEIFTDSADEREALEMIINLEETIQGKAKQLAKGILGDANAKALKKLIGK